jgi:hypothetical protein
MKRKAMPRPAIRPLATQVPHLRQATLRVSTPGQGTLRVRGGRNLRLRPVHQDKMPLP